MLIKYCPSVCPAGFRWINVFILVLSIFSFNLIFDFSFIGICSFFVWQHWSADFDNVSVNFTNTGCDNVITCWFDCFVQLHHESVTSGTFGRRGGPWEFNLRDIFRWCDLVSQQVSSVLQNRQSYRFIVWCMYDFVTEKNVKLHIRWQIVSYVFFFELVPFWWLLCELILLPFYRTTLCVSMDFAVTRCLSVCLSHWWIISRQLKISSNFLFGLVAPSV